MAVPPPPADMDVLQYRPMSSEVDMSFWSGLARRKLDEWKLDADVPRRVTGALSPASGRIALGDYSFRDSDEEERALPKHSVAVEGTLINFGRVEDFKAADKAAILADAAARAWAASEAGGDKAAAGLAPFVLLTFVDLKRHRHLYWFAFPALARSPALPAPARQAAAAEPVSASPHGAALRAMLASSDGPPGGRPFFLAARRGAAVEARPLEDLGALRADLGVDEVWPALVDACELPGNPGWTLRNFLGFVAGRFDGGAAPAPGWCRLPPVLAVRDTWGAARGGAEAPLDSVFFRVAVPSERDGGAAPRQVGWEPNARGKAGPRLVDLKALMDPATLAASSVDLNLKLMRWRVMPELDLDAVRSTRALLLGAGTLGCNVARTLMGWGVRRITLVDNGRVSYSNPVRQNLFTFADCSAAPDGGGLYKAPCAADALRRVFPGAETEGRVLTIPMPGHEVTPAQEEQARKDYDELVALVRSHDAVFLLTDSRESRWLPSLLCAAYHKPALNTAMGFDTFVVMRHGDNWAGSMPGEPEPPAPVAARPAAAAAAAAAASLGDASTTPLGCYFCNDVVAPTDSLTARTLDQQCTVTRPGLAPMCSAMAVELLVSMLHHPDRQRAPAGATTPLGELPHQLRGHVARFGVLPVVGQQSGHCTACSAPVLDAFRAGGFAFCLRAINDPAALEDVSGLRQLKAAADEALAGWDDGGESGEDDF